jgi:hypothetical protein
MGRAAGPGHKENDRAAHVISKPGRVGCGKAFARDLTVIEITSMRSLSGTWTGWHRRRAGQ